MDLQQVEEEAAKDEEYHLLQECVSNDGWTDYKDMEPLTLWPHFRMQRHLPRQGDLVMYTNEGRHLFLVIPKALRHSVLTNQGRQSMLHRMCQSVYWPGIDAEVRYARHAHSNSTETMATLPSNTLFSRSQHIVPARWLELYCLC